LNLLVETGINELNNSLLRNKFATNKDSIRFPIFGVNHRMNTKINAVFIPVLLLLDDPGGPLVQSPHVPYNGLWSELR